MFLEDIMVTKNIRLGHRELRLVLELDREETRIFDTRDAYRMLGTGKDSVNTALYRLRKKGRIEGIERGKYLLVPARAGYQGRWAEMPFLIARHLVEPYYVGFASALNHWNMTEQIPDRTYIATTKRKKNTEYGSLLFAFVTLTYSRFFGCVEETVDGGRVRISDREKTIIDGLLHPQYCGGLDEVAKGMWESQDELDKSRLLEYAERIGVRVVKRRLLYLLDILEMADDRVDDAMLTHRPTGYMWLDPAWAKNALEYSKKHGLIINRSSESLTRWRCH